MFSAKPFKVKPIWHSPQKTIPRKSVTTAIFIERLPPTDIRSAIAILFIGTISALKIVKTVLKN